MPLNRLIKFLIFFFVIGSCQKEEFKTDLQKLVNAAEQDEREVVAALWDEVTNNGLPIIEDTIVTFAYYGEAKKIHWNGDFNAWGADSKFHNQGTRIGNSNLWLLKTSFPIDARLDYKIVVDDQWIIDPNNPYRQYAGVGGGTPNSELRMPKWQPSKWVVNETQNNGSLSENKTLESESLGYDVNIKVYTPFGYTAASSYPVLYFTDGHEYSDQKLGASLQVIDNLIEADKIEPFIAVYIDPREFDNNSNNRRIQELVLNEKYASFISNELVTYIDTNYPTKKGAGNRGIFGTSLGGLFASYLQTYAPDQFGLVGIQSPAYWYRMEIFNLVESNQDDPIKLSMMCGTINDGRANAFKMKNIYESKGVNLQYFEVNQGHSWGSWKSALGDQLIFLFGK